MVIGITGGVGCGKSAAMTVLREKFGAKTLLADELGHEALQPESETYEEIRTLFGETVVCADGQLNRTLLAQIIYADENKRKELDDIIHPYVMRRIREYLGRWKEEPLVVVETALMFESGCHKLCDKIWYIRADREQRIKRLTESRGYTREKTEAIMAAQMGEEDICRRCDACIDNSDSLEKLTSRLQELLGI